MDLAFGLRIEAEPFHRGDAFADRGERCVRGEHHVVGGEELDPATQRGDRAVHGGIAVEHAEIVDWRAPQRVLHRQVILVHRAPAHIGEGVVDPATLDAAMCESGGFRMGPCELMDLIGLDIGLAVTRSVWQACHGDSRYAPSFLQEEMVAGNRLGRKTKLGFYDYREDAKQSIPVDAATGNKPDKVTIHGEWRPAKSLLMLLQNTDIEVSYKPGQFDFEFMIELENSVLAVTDGRPAYETAAKVFADFQNKNVIIFDLAFDYTITKRIIMAASDGCSMSSLNEAVGFFQALGKQVSIIDDSPGLIVGRIVCMLINEAADAVHRGICSVEDVDIAMTKGVNYPCGLLKWCDQLDSRYVATVIKNLRAVYTEERYRISPLLKRKAATGGKFYA